ncbi:MAG: hypothetical protein CMG71_04495 [Candidatus Marinimicrobia bacterium]|nr:hypothetical protein [Candidatus Neomarinimicrobiota bacterium]|tara:strand:- start:7362 stop:8450 length:1089 start_codon:yes stop_codon:yes gene_type:complete
MPPPTETVSLLSSLRHGDETAIQKAVDSAVVGGPALRDFFNELFTFSGEYHRCNWSSDGVVHHPLMELNALKNLASLRLDSPSRLIAEEAATICMKLDQQKQEMKLTVPTPEMLNRPLFTQEFIQAIGEAERERAVLEAAKISAVSDNPVSVIEIMMEIATYHMDRIGSFVYGIFRSAVFSGRDSSETFVKLLLTALMDEPWLMDVAEGNATASLAPYLQDALAKDDHSVIYLFAVGERLWQADSVRQPGFRKGLSVWAADRFEASAEQGSNDSIVSSTEKADILTHLDDENAISLSNAISQAREQQDWSWPVSIAERWIQSSCGDSSQFLLLDSLQSLLRTAPAKLIPVIAERLLVIDRLN